MEAAVILAEQAALGHGCWPATDEGGEPRHRLVPQPGDLAEYWRPYLEPAPQDTVQTARSEQVDDDETPPQVVRPYVRQQQKGRPSVSATPKDPNRTGPIPADEWAAGRPERQEGWLTAEPPKCVQQNRSA